MAAPALDKAGAWKKLNWKLDIPALKVNGSETLENSLEERYTFLEILAQGMLGASIGERMPSCRGDCKNIVLLVFLMSLQINTFGTL